VFDIGSYPLTFTQAAILWLAQQRRLKLEDPVSRFFPDAPADKGSITLQQLLDGTSGLPNFHGDVDRDRDHDLSPLSRDEALQRIFARRLLFAPGSETAFSHSAYGLLAAVVEEASGLTYQEFIRTRLLQPAGMSRTGFYGESLGLGPAQFAIGHSQQASDPNIPPQWGPTSWLILGSGGMVSTAADLQRYHAWIHGGALLTGHWLARYEASRMVVGGTDRGFQTLRARGGPGSHIIILSNPVTAWPAAQSLPRQISALLESATDP
jgi:CubicO group peptidase (beta-lactamase class C family)